MSQLSALYKSELMTYRQPTVSALREFEELLNQTHRALDEREMARVTHELFKVDPDAFYAMILKAPENVQYAILYTDTLYMTRFFGLLYIAHIKLTKYGFRVTPYHKKTYTPVELPGPKRPPLSRNAAVFKPAGWSFSNDKAPAHASEDKQPQTSLQILKRTLSIVEPNAINTQTLATSGNE